MRSRRGRVPRSMKVACLRTDAPYKEAVEIMRRLRFRRVSRVQQRGAPDKISAQLSTSLGNSQSRKFHESLLKKMRQSRPTDGPEEAEECRPDRNSIYE